MARSFYDRLGVEPTATPAEIKRAYYKLAAEHHPDRISGKQPEERRASENLIRLVNVAWAALGNPRSRALYDECLAQGLDYEQAVKDSAGESEMERAARERAVRAMEAARIATIQDLEIAIQKLDPAARWLPSEKADYFDAALEGKAGMKCYRVHLKVLPEVTPDDIASITSYAQGLVAVTEKGLVRHFHSYLLVGSSLRDERVLGSRTESFNGTHWRDARGRAPRAMIAYAAASAGGLALPGVNDPEPDLRLLPLGST